MTDNKVVTMELSEPVTEEMTMTASVPVSHQSVTSGSVLTPPTSGAKPKKRQPGINTNFNVDVVQEVLLFLLPYLTFIMVS